MCESYTQTFKYNFTKKCELTGNMSRFHLEIYDRREAQSLHTCTIHGALPSEASGKHLF